MKKNKFKVSEESVIKAVKNYLIKINKSINWRCNPISHNSEEIVYELFDHLNKPCTISSTGIMSRGFNCLSWYGDVKFRVLDLCSSHCLSPCLSRKFESNRASSKNKSRMSSKHLCHVTQSFKKVFSMSNLTFFSPLLLFRTDL